MSYPGNRPGADLDDAVGTAAGSGAGIMVKTGEGAGVRRSLQAGSVRITITNADGTAGDITIDIPADLPLNTAELVNLILSGAQGDGVQFAGESPTYGYADILGQIDVRGVGPNSPDYAQIAGTNLYAFQFAASSLDEVFVSFHIPHDYVPGTPVSFHAHWMGDQSPGHVGVVRWGFEWYYARNEQEALSNGTVYAEQAGVATALTPRLVESAEVAIPNLEVDSLILVRVFRDAANVADTNTDAVFLIQTDCHYQSTGVPTVNKARPFYAGG